MAIGKKSDFVIRDEEFEATFIETLNQNVDVFNSGSAGTVRVVTDPWEGEFNKTRFFDRPSGDYVRRDPTSTSTLTPTNMTQDEVIGVKVDRRYGPFEITEDAFRKAGRSPLEMSVMLAQNYAEERLKEMVNTAASALVTVIRENSSVVYDYADTGDNKTADHTALIRGRALFGDQFGKILAWFGNSGSWHDLVENQVSVASGNVADVVLMGGVPASLGLPFMVSDAPAFSTSGTPGEYHILGLTSGACVLTATEPPLVATTQEVLKENITRVFQGEDSYNITIKGMEYTGSANPNSSAIANASNWAPVVANLKDGPGVAIDVDQS